MLQLTINSLIYKINKLMWSQNNRFIQQLKLLVNKYKSQKITMKDLQNSIALFQGCMQTNMIGNQYEKIIELIVEVFVSSAHLQPNQGLYKCFKGLLELDVSENKTKKSNILLYNVIKICERSYHDQYDKDMERVLALVKKAGQKYLGSEIANIFIDHYLDKISKVAHQSKPSFDFKVYSALFTILYGRYRPSMTQKIQQSLILYQKTLIILLIEFKDNPQILWNTIIDKELNQGLAIPRQFIHNRLVFNAIHQYFIRAFIITIRQEKFDALVKIYRIYPHDTALEQEEELYTKLLMRIFKNPQEFGHDIDLANITIDRLYQFWVNRNDLSHHGKFIAWVKFICIWVFLSKINGKYHGQLYHNKQKQYHIFNLISQMPENHSIYYELYKDCLSMIHEKAGQQTWGQLKQKSKKESSITEINPNCIYEGYLLVDKKCRQYFEKVWKYNYQIINGSKQAQKAMEEEDPYHRIQSLSEFGSSSDLPIQNWKVAISVMIEYLKLEYLKKTQPNKISQQSIPLNQLAQTALQYFSVRPKFIKAHYDAFIKKQEEKLIDKNAFDFQCCRILGSMILKEVEVEKVAEHIRRMLSKEFDKVHDGVVKNLANNWFFINCILLTNNTKKCKTLFEYLLKKGERLGPYKLKDQLLEIFPLPSAQLGQIIHQYVQYLASRDKNKFKMQLYDKKMTHLDWLVSYSTSNFVLNWKSGFA